MSTDVPLPEPVAWLQVGVFDGPYEGETLTRAKLPGKYDPSWWRFDGLYSADQMRAYGDARAAALAGVLRLVVGDAEMFCRAAHHSKADRHEAFEPCPIHTRAVAALQEQKPKAMK